MVTFEIAGVSSGNSACTYLLMNCDVILRTFIVKTQSRNPNSRLLWKQTNNITKSNHLLPRGATSEYLFIPVAAVWNYCAWAPELGAPSSLVKFSFSFRMDAADPVSSLHLLFQFEIKTKMCEWLTMQCNTIHPDFRLAIQDWLASRSWEAFTDWKAHTWTYKYTDSCFVFCFFPPNSGLKSPIYDATGRSRPLVWHQ